MRPPLPAPARVATLVALSLGALLAGTTPAAAAEVLACPALAGATQVASCPTDEQLRLGYIGFCSDNSRVYSGDAQACANFEDYRRLKNVALWEAGSGGAFQGYLSCDVPAARVVVAVPRSVAVSRQGTVTRVACQYDDGLVLTLRTKARCAVPPASRCADDPAACQVRCD